MFTGSGDLGEDNFGYHYSFHHDLKPLRFADGKDARMRERNETRMAAGFLTGDAE